MSQKAGKFNRIFDSTLKHFQALIITIKKLINLQKIGILKNIVKTCENNFKKHRTLITKILPII